LFMALWLRYLRLASFLKAFSLLEDPGLNFMDAELLLKSHVLFFQGSGLKLSFFKLRYH
jgi:hypothetical protein